MEKRKRGRPKKGEEKKIGRPRKHIDKELFEEMCEYQCTMQEICLGVGVTDKTLTNWCKETYGKSFSEIFKEKRVKGFASLRATQYRLAKSGNATMLIWLGRNWLGQTDKPPEPKEEKTQETPIEQTPEFVAKYNAMKANLLKQLEKKKAGIPLFEDLVNDYMLYWTLKEKLKSDIDKRGLFISYNNGGGQSGEKENPSMEKLLKVSSKLKEIQLQLEISVENSGDSDDEL